MKKKQTKVTLDSIKKLCYQGKKPNWGVIIVIGILIYAAMEIITTLLENIGAILLFGGICLFVYYRFKNPRGIKLTETKKVYSRFCTRCGRKFETEGKNDYICDECDKRNKET